MNATCIIRKRALQQMLKQLKENGYIVKEDAIRDTYSATDLENITIFKALRANDNYLVRYDSTLWA